jgi:putative methionine-R-sulfoxide reductase with GAF domain
MKWIGIYPQKAESYQSIIKQPYLGHFDTTAIQIEIAK